MLVAHADWSVDPRKRYLSVATRHADSWRLAAPVLVGDVPTMLPRLLAMAGGQPVALGIDMPLGLPRAYAAHCAAPDFPAFLRTVPPEFFQVAASLAQVSRQRPFYPARGIAGMTRAAHAAALGLLAASDLSRLCDRATKIRPAGAPVFWTLGANQSGKAAIVGWRDMLRPAWQQGVPLRLWPFDGGDFLSLLSPATVTVAETYPAEAQRHLGLRLVGSKRRQADRAGLAGALRAAMNGLGVRAMPLLSVALDDGFGADAAGEDRFDSVLGVLCVINVINGNRPDGCPNDRWVRLWEGWVLGQTEMPL
jgi:hypothetical protein